ncbi:MAG: alpha/beta hydrolase [Gemmatimonadota bacterium]
MRFRSLLAPACFALVGLTTSAATPYSASGQHVERHDLTTSDGVTIPAWLYTTPETEAAPLVVLFHQGGSSGRAEYAPIVPRLRELGYAALVIDQRRGGELFEAQNEVAVRFDPETTSYCDPLPDLEAALEFARRLRPEQRVVLWGSSYSAALVVQLGVRRAADVAGVLAFSPASGEPMAGCEPEPWAARLERPLFAARPANEVAIPEIQEQLDELAALGAVTWVADPGRHGSSMLVEERVGASTGPTWAAVEAFLSALSFDPAG